MVDHDSKDNLHYKTADDNKEPHGNHRKPNRQLSDTGSAVFVTDRLDTGSRV